MSAVPERDTPVTILAGWLAALSITAAAIGIIHKPVRLIPAAMVLALIAAAIGGPQRRLATAAVVFSTVAFVAGMTVAVLAEMPLW